MPYWRLSGFYFFYFATLGTLIPYWGLYLKSLGFSALEIGQLMTILMLTKTVAPYFWGWLSDHLGTLTKILKIGTFLAAILFSAVFWVTDFTSLAITMALFSFFWNAVLPQFEVITLRYIHDRISKYAQIRLWGSIGFIIAVFFIGIAIDYWQIQIILPILMALYISIWLLSLLISEPIHAQAHLSNKKITTILKKKVVIAFLVAAFLMQVSHGAYYSFYSILLAENHYSKTIIGALWALGVIAEIIIFMITPRLMQTLEIKT